MTEAVLEAYQETDVDLCEVDQTLFDQVESDAVNMLFSDPQDGLRVTAQLWGYVAVLTPERVILYAET